MGNPNATSDEASSFPLCDFGKFQIGDFKVVIES